METLSIYTSESTEDMPNHEKLNKSIFCIYLGGKHPKANIEMHDLVITSGNSIQDCFQYCRDNWFANADGKGTKIKPHIDGYFQVDFDKSYVNTGEYKLFLMNYGGYLADQLAETHEFITVFAKNKGEDRKSVV